MTLARMDLVLEVREIDASIEYYTRTLGFELTGRAGTEGEQRLDRGLGADDWAHVEAGATSLVFVPLEGGAENSVPVMTGSIYLYPEDVDKAWDELHEHVEVTWPIRTWPYGMREFGVRDVNGYWLVFGQAVDDLSPRVGTLSLPRLVDRAKTGDEVRKPPGCGAGRGRSVCRPCRWAWSFAFPMALRRRKPLPVANVSTAPTPGTSSRIRCVRRCWSGTVTPSGTCCAGCLPSASTRGRASICTTVAFPGSRSRA